MNRVQKLKRNSSVSLLSRLVIIISGLILPRLILDYFGSETNGLIASIKQFLNIIMFLDLGVGSVVQSALYKPLAHNDYEMTSKILASAKSYFRKISYFLVIYVLGLIIFYPLIVNNSLNYVATAFLILALSLNLFAQYYFGIINELLLNANQQAYVQLGSEIVVVILNLLINVVLITQGFSIVVVQLVAGLIYLLRPLYLAYYVKRNFNIDLDVEVEEDLLPQKWNGMAQHIAYTIQNSTDIVVLTMFSTLENVSVYSVYNLVVTAIRSIIASLTTGLNSFFGSLIASDEIDALNDYFSKIEWAMHTGVIYLYGMTAVLINSFVMLYTAGVEDVNYYAPVFSLLLVLAKAAYSLRTPYQMMVFAAGHYKQTQLSSFIEAALNVGISLLLINKLGLVGIALGTLSSMVYRTAYLSWYLSKNIVFRPIKIFIKQISVDILTFSIMYVSGQMILSVYPIGSIIDWIVIAILLGIVFLVFIIIINAILYKPFLDFAFRKLVKRAG